MDTTQAIYFILGNLVVMLPQLIVIIIGIIFAFTKFSRTPQVSKLAIAGLGIMLLIGISGLVVTAIQLQLPSWLGMSLTTVSSIMTAVRLILNIVWAVGLGLLIYSVWVGRNEQ